MFDRTGIIEFDHSVASDDAMLDAAIEAGADDVVSAESGHEIYASQETFRDVAKALEAKFGEPRKAAMTWKPQNTVAVDDETGEKLLKLMDLLNEHDDVQNVFANFEVSDALMAKMGGVSYAGNSGGFRRRSVYVSFTALWRYHYAMAPPPIRQPVRIIGIDPGPAPHRLGRDRERGQPADLRRLRLGGAGQTTCRWQAGCWPSMRGLPPCSAISGRRRPRSSRPLPTRTASPR